MASSDTVKNMAMTAYGKAPSSHSMIASQLIFPLKQKLLVSAIVAKRLQSSSITAEQQHVMSWFCSVMSVQKKQIIKLAFMIRVENMTLNLLAKSSIDVLQTRLKLIMNLQV